MARIDPWRPRCCFHIMHRAYLPNDVFFYLFVLMMNMCRLFFMFEIMNRRRVYSLSTALKIRSRPNACPYPGQLRLGSEKCNFIIEWIIWGCVVCLLFLHIFGVTCVAISAPLSLSQMVREREKTGLLAMHHNPFCTHFLTHL